MGEDVFSSMDKEVSVAIYIPYPCFLYPNFLRRIRNPLERLSRLQEHSETGSIKVGQEVLVSKYAFQGPLL